MNRILITGKNCEIPRNVVSGGSHVIPFQPRSNIRNSGAVPESAAGGTRSSYAFQTTAPGSYPLPLASPGATPFEIVLYSVFAFVSGFGLAWSFLG